MFHILGTIYNPIWRFFFSEGLKAPSRNIGEQIWWSRSPPSRQVERLGADYANLREQRHLRRCHAEGTRETVRVQFDLDVGDGGTCHQLWRIEPWNLMINYRKMVIRGLKKWWFNYLSIKHWWFNNQKRDVRTNQKETKHQTQMNRQIDRPIER